VTSFRALACAFALLLPGCGYHLANGASEAFSPELGEVSSPHPTVAAALLDGARAELARHGALAASGGAVLRVDLLRVDERAEGLVSGGSAAAVSSFGATPVARAVRVTVVGRARLDGARVRDTGDVEASDVVATATTSAGGQIAADAVAEAAARRLGARLARKIIGLPEP
jgi:hypothetical protein